MERPGWRLPSPALVIACLALFVALGGTVLAATKIDGRTVRIKSLPGNRLMVGSVPGNRLKPGTIPDLRLAPNSVKGAQIDLSTLGTVPNAEHAESAGTARHAETAVAAEHAADATTINGRAVGCGAGKTEFAGACWDLNLKATALEVVEAANTCAGEGGELPEPLALLAFNRLPGTPADIGGEWTKAMKVEAGGFWSGVLAEGTNQVFVTGPTTPHYFRCVTPLLS